MSEQLETAWHHECANPECGIMMTLSLEDEDGAARLMSAPESEGEFAHCPICKSGWGPWQPGPAPEYDEDDYDPVLDNRPCFGAHQDCDCGNCAGEVQ